MAVAKMTEVYKGHYGAGEDTLFRGCPRVGSYRGLGDWPHFVRSCTNCSRPTASLCAGFSKHGDSLGSHHLFLHNCFWQFCGARI